MLIGSSSGFQVERQNQCHWHLTSRSEGEKKGKGVCFMTLKMPLLEHKSHNRKAQLISANFKYRTQSPRSAQNSGEVLHRLVKGSAVDGFLSGMCCFFHVLPLASLCLCKFFITLPLATLQLAFKWVKSTYTPRSPLYQVASREFTTSCFKVIGIIMCRKIAFLMVAWKIYTPKM